MKLKNIVEFLDSWAPRELAEEWDNPGLQIGREAREIKKVILALDLDHRVVEGAGEGDLIITHHPFIFTGLKSITDKDYSGQLIMDVLDKGISYYAAHTNLDKIQDGVNYQLAKAFDLKNTRVLSITDEFQDQELGYGLVGDIEEIELGDFIGLVKEKLDIDRCTVYGEVDRKISRLALAGGSGASFIGDAHKEGADLYITGDIKYHDAQEADRLGLSLIDAGHFHTEKLVLARIGEKLSKEFPGLDIEIYSRPSPAYKIY